MQSVLPLSANRKGSVLVNCVMGISPHFHPYFGAVHHYFSADHVSPAPDDVSLPRGHLYPLSPRLSFPLFVTLQEHSSTPHIPSPALR